ncbi:MAG: hypothetical protein KME30_32740 [Iphinoe sp. HA4291-MV1]|nr:hypothetical protein [Iphinoe sp. HA4291-MV1]
MTNICLTRWSDWYHGKSSLSEPTLRKMAQSLNVSPGTVLDWLMEWRKKDPIPKAKIERYTLASIPYSKWEFFSLSNRELKDQTGILESRWSEWYSGKIALSELSARKIGRVLGISPGTAFDWVMEWRERDPLE